MSVTWSGEVYSPREIARAAGVPDDRVVAMLGSADVFLGWADAVHLGRSLIRPTPADADLIAAAEPGAVDSSRIFSVYERPATHTPAGRGLPLAISSTLHVAAVGAALIVTTLGLAPAASVSAVSKLA